MTPLMFLQKEKVSGHSLETQGRYSVNFKDLLHLGKHRFRFSTTLTGAKLYSSHHQKVYSTVFPFVNQNQEESGDK